MWGEVQAQNGNVTCTCTALDVTKCVPENVDSGAVILTDVVRSRVVLDGVAPLRSQGARLGHGLGVGAGRTARPPDLAEEVVGSDRVGGR